MGRKQHILSVSLACLIGSLLPLHAQGGFHPSASRQPRHYLALSFGGGEASNILTTSTDSVRPLLGAAAHLSLHYEVQYRSWLFGIAAEGQYQYLRDEALTPFADVEQRQYTDPLFGEHDLVNYAWCYSRYTQQHTVLHAAVSLYVGREFAQYFYALVGARFSYPLYASYDVQADLGTRIFFRNAIQDVSSDLFTSEEVKARLYNYGVFEQRPYTYRASYTEYMRLSPFAEVGGYVPLPNPKTRLRIGLYAAYAVRLGSKENNALTDYSAVARDYGAVQSPQMLQQTLRWSPLLQSDRYTSLPHNLEVGARLTFLFDVTIQKRICKCER